jgi:hypothetical protein
MSVNWAGVISETAVDGVKSMVADPERWLT